MEFRDLKSQYLKYKDSFDAAMIEVAAGSHYIGGSQVGELEDKLSEYVGVKHCISCANGTDALELALMAWGIGEGDAVFVPDFTFFSSGEVVSSVGAIPIFVDVKKDSFNIDPESLKKAIEHTKNNTELNPKVVIAVDLFGLPAEFDEIKKIAAENNLLVLEDAAQGFGGMINQKKACSFGDIATTSFFPAKPLGCYGDGGAIFTDNDEWAAMLKSLKVHGKGSNKYDNVRIGMNSRLDTIQAAVLLTKMTFFDEETSKVADRAALYSTEFEKAGCESVITPVIPDGYFSSYAQYTILLPDVTSREKVMGVLKDKGIPSMVYYQKPMHMQKAFDYCARYQVGADENEDPCPVTTEICGRCLSLPLSAYLTDEEISTIVEGVTCAL